MIPQAPEVTIRKIREKIAYQTKAGDSNFKRESAPFQGKHVKVAYKSDGRERSPREKGGMYSASFVGGTIEMVYYGGSSLLKKDVEQKTEKCTRRSTKGRDSGDPRVKREHHNCVHKNKKMDNRAHRNEKFFQSVQNLELDHD